MIATHTPARCPFPALHANASSPSVDDGAAMGEAGSSPRPLDQSQTHWLDLALAVWLDEPASQGSPSQNANEH